MSNARTLLVALPPTYFDQFVGDGQMRRLEDAFETVLRVDPNALTEGKWDSTFQDVRPGAVLSGWGTPRIPESAVPPLQFVAHTAGSVRHLLSRAMIERGLLVTNWGALTAPIVAEHALALTLATLRRFAFYTLRIHVERGWDDLASASGVSLFGKRVGLHGFGQIARHLVKLITPFGCRIQAFSAGVPDSIFADADVARARSLETLFAESDVLIEVEALTDATRGSVTESLLRSLPFGAAFINVGRGATVDQAALTRVAQEGRIHVGLDVYDEEPLPAAAPLRGLPNVMLTPHVGGPTIDRRRACGAHAVTNLLEFVRGKIPPDVITPAIYDRST